MKIKSNGLLFLIFFFISHVLSAAIDADVSTAVYFQDEKPFLEVSLHVVASTLNIKELPDQYVETRVNILMTIQKDENIVAFEKYNMVSPKSINASDFIDLRRFVLEPGSYTLKIEITDQLNNKNTFNYNSNIIISSWQNDLNVSPISLIASIYPSEDESNPYFKYGNIFEPAAFNFFHDRMKNLYVFAELYNTQSKFEDQTYAVKLAVYNLSSSEPLKVKYKKFKGSKQQVLLESIPILDLPSDNYNLVLEIINAQNESFYTQKIPFQRSNPSYDKEILLSNNYDLEGNFINNLTEEELRYNLIALSPRLRQSEATTVNLLLNENNIKGQRYYLYNYWVNYDPVKTEETFRQYEKIAQAVDNMFYSTVGFGFQTDRGYIFLKYGRPDNTISVENEATAPPYEIWFYDKLDSTGETNVKFLFYNPSLGGYDFQLLHSTSRFEKQNRQWEVELYSDSPNDVEDNPIDATTVKRSFSRRAREYFNDNN